MKNKIRTPTSGSVWKKCAVVFLSVLFCFSLFCVCTCAGNVINESVKFQDLNKQPLPDAFGIDNISVFNDQPGVLSFTDPKNVMTSTSPDYWTGNGYTYSSTSYYSTIRSESSLDCFVRFDGVGLTRSKFVVVALGLHIPGNVTFETYGDNSANAKVSVYDLSDGSKIVSSYMVVQVGDSSTTLNCGFSFSPSVPATNVHYLTGFCREVDVFSDSNELITKFENITRGYSFYITGKEVSNMTTLLTEIVQLLFGGLTGAATALGQGANTFVTSLFIAENNALATYGGLVVIFAGVALAIGFTTRIFSWLTSLGN